MLKKPSHPWLADSHSLPVTVLGYTTQVRTRPASRPALPVFAQWCRAHGLPRTHSVQKLRTRTLFRSLLPVLETPPSRHHRPIRVPSKPVVPNAQTLIAVLDQAGIRRYRKRLSSASRSTACLSEFSCLGFSRFTNFQRTAARFPASGKPIRLKSEAGDSHRTDCAVNRQGAETSRDRQELSLKNSTSPSGSDSMRWPSRSHGRMRSTTWSVPALETILTDSRRPRDRRFQCRCCGIRSCSA